jgi:hypothetical protein
LFKAEGFELNGPYPGNAQVYHFVPTKDGEFPWKVTTVVLGETGKVTELPVPIERKNTIEQEEATKAPNVTTTRPPEIQGTTQAPREASEGPVQHDSANEKEPRKELRMELSEQGFLPEPKQQSSGESSDKGPTQSGGKIRP